MSRRLVGCSLLALVSSACQKESPAADHEPAALSALPSAAAAAASAPAAQPSCKLETRKVWGGGGNQRAGITPTKLSDGRVAFGFAYGNRPTILVFDRDARGEVIRTAVADDVPIAKEIKAADGTRDLQRVTPALSGRTLRAYVDHRDKLKSKKDRTVWCGAADSKTALTSFDGKPLLDVDDTGKTRGTPVAQPSAAPAVSSAPVLHAVAPFASLKPVASGAPTEAASGAPSSSAPTTTSASAPPKDAPEPEKTAPHEVRDCRSIVAPGGEKAWALGSELRGDEKDGKTRWKMRFFARTGGGDMIRIHEESLGTAPTKLPTFENPVAYELADGSTFVAARWQGQLLGWLLDGNKHPKGGLKNYPGGYPTLPRFFEDGATTHFLLARKTTGDNYGLWWGAAASSPAALPASLAQIKLDVDPSLAEPSMASIGGRKLLLVQAGARTAAKLMLVPVNDQLAAVGPALSLAEGKTGVIDSRIAALGGDKVVVVYLRSSSAGTELASETYTCG